MITIAGTSDMGGTYLVQASNHAYDTRYVLFDMLELYFDLKEIAYLFELYIRECGLKCTGIRQPLRLTTNCALLPKRIDQWDYG